MNRLAEVVASNMCAGCGLCASSPQGMKIDERGFSRPINIVHDQISLDCCPGIQLNQINRKNYNSSWGPIETVQVGYSADSTIRRMGSSGGVITALLAHLLKEKIVDAVIQTTASTVNPIANETIIVTEHESLVANAGSRYAPSSPLAVIRELIGNGKKYAVVGKPCDIAALRAATRIDERINAQFPFLLSFMCAGVPSEHSAEAVIAKMGLELKNIAKFRYRGDGWPGLTKADTFDGHSRTMTYNETWGTILNKDLQARCKVCADGTGESADVVCADAWYVSKKGYPSFEEKDGRSLIVARTPLGESLVRNAIATGFIEGVDEFDVKNLIEIQPYQYNRKRTVLVRLAVLKIFGIKTPRFKGFDIFRLFVQTPPAVSAKAAIGTILRKVKGRF